MALAQSMGRHRPFFARRTGGCLLHLDRALAAFGHNGDMGTRVADVPVANIVGTAGRPFDFDHEFRLVNRGLRERWQQLARAVESGFEPPPVNLVQLGQLYFVRDGHHRVSVARARGQLVVTAHVQRICTVAYAMACVRAAHLPNKAAERRFLERIPLPTEVREDLWLDHPVEWMRLADAAEAWGLRRSLEHGAPADRCVLADTWWTEEVVPVLGRVRDAGVGLDLRDVQLYVAALGTRDRLGSVDWPDDLPDRLAPTVPDTRTRSIATTFG